MTLSGTVERVTELKRPSAAKSAQMAKIRSRDTSPELAIRSELHRRGLRYRVDMPLPDVGRVRPDIVFTRVRVALFVDGCFWHRCPQHESLPKTNADWWLEKLNTNVERDRRADEALTLAGWRVIRIWEHQDPVTAAEKVEVIVRSRYTET